MVFGLLAAVLLVHGLVGPAPVPVRLIALLTAAGFLPVIIAYAAGTTAPFGKRADGTIPLWSWAMGWSFYSLGFASMVLSRRLSDSDPSNRIMPRMILGRRPSTLELEALAHESALAILDVTAEYPAVRLPGIEYKNIPVLDGCSPTVAQLELGAAWLSHHIRDRVVYVHCAAGYERSATFVAAHLLREGHCQDPIAATRWISERRPRAAPTSEQQSVLEAFHATLKQP
jgi:hypothetical protein